GDLPVPRIAKRAGYGSQEAFTRAFKTAYGVPPARYRASFVPVPTSNRTEDTMETTLSYEVTIRQQPAITVAALAHRGDYAMIGSTFERLAAIAGGQGLWGPTTRSFGIYYDDPKGSRDPRADAWCHSAIGLVATRRARASRGSRRTICGGASR